LNCIKRKDDVDVLRDVDMLNAWKSSRRATKRNMRKMTSPHWWKVTQTVTKDHGSLADDW
jgi:hypothetical protein